MCQCLRKKTFCFKIYLVKFWNYSQKSAHLLIRCMEHKIYTWLPSWQHRFVGSALDWRFPLNSILLVYTANKYRARNVASLIRPLGLDPTLLKCHQEFEGKLNFSFNFASSSCFVENCRCLHRQRKCTPVSCSEWHEIVQPSALEKCTRKFWLKDEIKVKNQRQGRNR